MRHRYPYFTYLIFMLCCGTITSSVGLLAQTGVMPTVSFKLPTADQIFRVGEYINVVPETGTFDPAYLSVENKQSGWVKFKLGYDPKNLWTPPQNVKASGNNAVEIILKDLKGGLDWSKIRLHPQGNANEPISLAKYIVAGQDVGGGWLKISIPIADFYAGINFAALSYLEFPYSADAGAFQIGIRDIRFVGGTQNLVWWGSTKHDNVYDGGIAMTAEKVARKTYSDGIEKVVFQYNDRPLGTDYTFPFGLLWINPSIGTHSLRAIAYKKNGVSAISDPLSIHVIENDSAHGANGKLLFPFNLPTIVLSHYRGSLTLLQRATLAHLPYTYKQSRWQLRATKPIYPKKVLFEGGMTSEKIR